MLDLYFILAAQFQYKFLPSLPDLPSGVVLDHLQNMGQLHTLFFVFMHKGRDSLYDPLVVLPDLMGLSCQIKRCLSILAPYLHIFIKLMAFPGQIV